MTEPYDYSNLLGLIKSKRITHEELARKIQMHPSTLSSKLNNNSEFTQKQMRAIMAALDKTVDDIPDYFFFH